MNFINGKKVWIFLMILMLMVSSFYLWQSGQRQKKAYAGGRIVEQSCPKQDLTGGTVWKKI